MPPAATGHMFSSAGRIGETTAGKANGPAGAGPFMRLPCYALFSGCGRAV
jgi:hypothetical protein